MFWMAATGKGGKDLFDPSLAERHGHYGEYLKGDINALHISYFRRNEFLPEVNFQIVTLRKTTVNNSGPRMATGPDPIPAIPHVWGPFRIRVIKYGPHFRFSVNGLSVLEWKDEGKNASVFKGGKIGFRQMRGLIADYSNLKVQRVTKDSDR